MTPVSLQVAPAALSGAGVSIAGLGDGLTAAVGALTAAYNANTGQDAAGSAFGVAYRDSAKAVVDAAAAGVNALRNTGYKIQGSASNYSRAEAAADIRGGAAPLPSPPTPATYSAPSGGPDVNGSGVAAPLLWGLVEALVGDFWPNGRPNEMRSAAAAWSVFATPLYNVTSDNAGPYGVIDAQQIPEKDKMKAAVRDIGTAMSSLAGEAQSLASELNGVAAEVETTQNAIRSLLDTLKSVVGSILDKGILGTVIELVTDDAEEKIQQVADDIKAVIANHRRQVEARKQAVGMLISNIRNYSRAMEIVARGELVHYLGEDAGRIVANINDAITDTSVGIANGAINTVGGMTTLDPIGDPKGTWATIEGLSKTAMALNPMTMPTALATDPTGTVDTLKDVTHFDDIVTNDRPFIGVGELGFDIGTAVVPGGAAAKAGAGARAAEGAAARSELVAGERAAGEVAGMRGVAGRLEGVADAAGGAKARLDDIANAPAARVPEVTEGGAPQSIPGASKPIESPVAREPAPHHPGSVGTDPKPASAHPAAEPVSPPATHTHEGGPASRGEVPSAARDAGLAVLPDGPPATLSGAEPEMSLPHADTPALAATANESVPGGVGPHASASSSGGAARDVAPSEGGPPHSGADEYGEGGSGRGTGQSSHGDVLGEGDSGVGGHNQQGDRDDSGGPSDHPVAPISDGTGISPEKLQEIVAQAADPGLYPPGSLPSLDDLRGLTTSEPDKAYYWSGRDASGTGVGPDGSGIAERIAREADGTTLEISLEKNGLTPLPVWNDLDPESVRFWEDASAAYADNASGVVTAVVGSNLRPGNIWQTVEIPRLIENPNVTAIIQIDPDTGLETVIFQR